MILFADWKIQATGLIARQYDNLSRRLEVVGDLPAGWDWAVLVRAEGTEGAEDIIALKPMDGGVGTTLDRNQLSISGYYSLQLRGTRGEVVKHTNIVQAFVPESLTGNGHWPSVPSEFREVEERILDMNAHPPTPGPNGTWLVWDAGSEAYTESDITLPEGNTVWYTEQNLTQAQQAQARANIAVMPTVLALDSMIDLTWLGVKAGSMHYAAANTAILQGLIETYPTGQRTFYLPAGTYHFDPIDLTGIRGTITVRMKGQGYGLDTDWFSGLQTTVITNKQDFLYDKRTPSEGVTFYVDDMRFYSYQGYSEIPTGVCFGAETNGGSEHNFHFHNVQIHGFDYGFRSPGYSCGGSGGKNISFSTCHYGIWINAASHLFYIENLELTYNRVGVRLCHGGGPCSIKNVHVATGYLGADREDFDEYIVFHTKGNTIIEKVYHEAYENGALPGRTILFDFEGWAYGCGPLIIKDTYIGAPGGKLGGKFLRARGYLGAGPETGAATVTEIPSSLGRLNHYPRGLVLLENCGIETYDRSEDEALLALFDVIQHPTYHIANGIDLGRDIFSDSGVITKDWVVRGASYCNSVGVRLDEVTCGDDTFKLHPWYGYKEPLHGLTLHNMGDLGFLHKTYITQAKGYLEILEDATNESLNVVYGLAAKYKLDGETVVDFYPIARLTHDTAKEGNNFPFDFSEITIPTTVTGNVSLQFAQKLMDTTNNANGLANEIVKVRCHVEFRVSTR